MQGNRLNAVVAGTAFCVLGLELLLARVFPFVLGDISAFATIPIAMLGLSLGALGLHFLSDEAAEDALGPACLAFGAAVVVGLLALFGLFNGPLGIIHHNRQDPTAALLRVVLLPGTVLPAYALAGAVLSLSFRAASERLGRLYALDLGGSALACLLAPLLLRVAEMELTLACVCAAALAVAAVGGTDRPAVRRGLGLVAVALLVTTALGLTLHARPDPEVLGARYARGRAAEEVTSIWNDVSRVSVMQYANASGSMNGGRRRLIHDDGISNVWVHPYRPEFFDGAPRPGGTAPESLVTLFSPRPQRALVMFAGAGADMARLGEYFGGGIDLTGVELNPAIPKLAQLRRGDRIAELYARDDFDLQVAEGRGFLDRTDDLYDLIYVACNGSQFSTRTGHSRKFLDTHEAMEAYLRHRAPHGVIAFNMQDIDQKLESFKRLHADLGNAVPFADAVLLTGRRRYKDLRLFDRLYYRAEGFAPAERAALAEQLPYEDKRTEYLRFGGPETEPKIEAIVASPPDPELFVPTDDHPYPRRVDFAGWTPRPSAEVMKIRLNAMSWVKVLTLILASLATVLLGAVFGLSRRGGHRLPVGPAAWFLSTGVAYMLVQIGLMGKLDLLIGNPLWAIAAVLASFLLANAGGAFWIGTKREAGAAPPAFVLPLGAAGALVLSAGGLEYLAAHALGWPMAVKVLLALAVPAPVAFVLGTLYPTGVGVVTDRGLATLVPATFGVATLSSVFGATFAMVWVINVGFGVLLLCALGLYVLIAAVSGATRFGVRS